MKAKKVFRYLFILLETTAVFAAKAKFPSWVTHKEVAFPSEYYITAEGEGHSVDEAKLNALSQISLYFNTKSTVQNDLARIISESENEKDFSHVEKTYISETARIESEASFFSVQFAEPYTEKKIIHILAYIEREKAFSVYKEEISRNAATIKGLLKIAADLTNPVSALKAAEEACEASNAMTPVIRNARIIKNLSEKAFAEECSLIEKSYNALKICRNSLSFRIEVHNDWNSAIATTLSKILEENGYALSEEPSTAPSVLVADVSQDIQTFPQGIFVTLSIQVYARSNLVNEGLSPAFFSYSRTMDRKGAKSEQDALRRAYSLLQEELESSFEKEFSERVQLKQ